MALEGAPLFDGPGPSFFTGEERAALAALRDQRWSREGYFNDKQLAHLAFVRWLCRTGRLASDTAAARASGLE